MCTTIYITTIDNNHLHPSASCSVKNTLNDPNVAGKLDAGDKSKLEELVKETLDWLDHNQLAEEEEFEDKRKALEEVASPIFARLYQGGAEGGAGAGAMPDMGGGGGGGGGATGGPTVEEVD